MTTSLGPDGIVDGLICCLDPSNPKSYPGSGTRLFDLSGNGNHGTLTNGPTWSAVNQGVIVLDGTNDFIDVPINLSTSDYTVMGAARFVTVTGRTFSAKNNNWLMGHWNGTTENYYAEGWVSAAGAGTGAADTNWRFYAATSEYTIDTWAFYVNGSLRVRNSSGVSGPNGFAIGSYAGTSEFSYSHIGLFLVYNRSLSTDEIGQVFRSIKSRFTL